MFGTEYDYSRPCTNNPMEKRNSYGIAQRVSMDKINE